VCRPIVHQNPFSGVGCRPPEEPQKKENSGVNRRCTKLQMSGEETSEDIVKKFGIPTEIKDIITQANFGSNQSTGGGVTCGQILPFSIGLRLVCPYNTATL